MDIALHHITEGSIDQPMPLDEGLVLKRSGDYVHDEMAAAAGGTRVSGMFGAFVDYFQQLGLQDFCQAGADSVGAFAGHVRGVPS